MKMKMIMQGNDWGDAQDIEIVFRGLLTPPPRHNKKPHQTPQNTIVHTKCNYSFPCFVVYPPCRKGSWVNLWVRDFGTFVSSTTNHPAASWFFTAFQLVESNDRESL